jgi:surfeit locus 1 family protein
MRRSLANARLGAALAAAVGVAVTAWLGSWQLERAAEKRALQQRIDQAQHRPPVQLPWEPVPADTLAYQRVEAHGEFRPELTILLDNRVREGRVGYEVITPLRLAPGELHVLVNRGWVQAPRTRQELPAVVTPAGPVRVEGIALPPSKRYLELSSRTVSGAVWQNLDLERFAAAHKMDLQSIVLQQRNDAADGLLRAWPRPDAGVDTHRAYALQWFAMSALIAVAYALLFVRGWNARRSIKR